MPWEEIQRVSCEKCGADALWRKGWYKLCFQHFCEMLAIRSENDQHRSN